jgi:hypothetical protein
MFLFYFVFYFVFYFFLRVECCCLSRVVWYGCKLAKEKGKKKSVMRLPFSSSLVLGVNIPPA